MILLNWLHEKTLDGYDIVQDVFDEKRSSYVNVVDPFNGCVLWCSIPFDLKEAWLTYDFKKCGSWQRVTKEDCVIGASNIKNIPPIDEGMSFDYALPQTWVNGTTIDNDVLISNFVWAYMPRDAFGMPLPITETGRRAMLRNSLAGPFSYWKALGYDFSKPNVR